MSDVVLRTRFNAQDFENLKEELNVWKHDIQDAIRAAVKDCTAIIKEDLGDEMAKITGIKARVINGRINLKYRYQSGHGSVWMGLNPIPLKRLGPRQNKAGVKAGPVFVKSAFIVKGLGKNVFLRRGDARLPIDKQAFDIKDQGEETMGKLSDRVETLFMRVLRVKLSGAKGRTTRKRIDPAWHGF